MEKLMTMRCAIVISVALISLAVFESTPTASSVANYRAKIGQAEKPFDQEQALASLRQAIAGKEENRPRRSSRISRS